MATTLINLSPKVAVFFTVGDEKGFRSYLYSTAYGSESVVALLLAPLASIGASNTTLTSTNGSVDKEVLAAGRLRTIGFECHTAITTGTIETLKQVLYYAMCYVRDLVQRSNSTQFPPSAALQSGSSE